MHCDKTNESSADILIPYERDRSSSSVLTLIMVGGDVPFYLTFWAKVTLQKRRLPIDIRSYSASIVIPSEKSSIMTNRKSPTSFPMSIR